MGGCGGYRVALNIGTKDEPRFGRREFLFHVDGTILHTRRKAGMHIANGLDFHITDACSQTAHCYLNPVDWDGDGVLDIIATDEYTRPGEYGVYFFRGVRTDDGLRFEQARPLFLATDGTKALPGCTPHIQVVDWNGDGVQDILMGLSIPTINGFEGATDIYWQWIHDLGLQSPGKDAGEALQYYGTTEEFHAKLKEQEFLKRYLIGKLDDWKYATLRHRGFVFLFEGQANKQRAVAIPMKAEPCEFEYDKPAAKEMKLPKIERKPVSCHAYIRHDDGQWNVCIKMNTTGNYHLYTDNRMNEDKEPVIVEITLPEGIRKEGELKRPPVVLYGANEVYDGKQLTFIQKLEVEPGLTGTCEVKVKVSWQTCSDETCLPPETYEETCEIELP